MEYDKHGSFLVPASRDRQQVMPAKGALFVHLCRRNACLKAGNKRTKASKRTDPTQIVYIETRAQAESKLGGGSLKLLLGKVRSAIDGPIDHALVVLAVSHAATLGAVLGRAVAIAVGRHRRRVVVEFGRTVRAVAVRGAAQTAAALVAAVAVRRVAVEVRVVGATVAVTVVAGPERRVVGVAAGRVVHAGAHVAATAHSVVAIEVAVGVGVGRVVVGSVRVWGWLVNGE